MEATAHAPARGAQGGPDAGAAGVPSWRSRDVGVRLLWRAARAWASAVVVAGFPVLFLLDGWVEWRLSPVLPGLCLLVAVLVVLPIGLWELWARRHARLDADARDKRATHLRNSGRVALGVAWAWFLAWLLWGV